MSTKKPSQVDAVVNAVTEVLGDSFVVGTTVVSQALSTEQKQQVRALVKESILNGTTPYGKDLQDEKALNRYVNGMVNNSLMKSKKLNGGSQYKPQKRGVPRDATLRELNKFLATQTPGTPKYEEVSAAIVKRKAELTEVAGQIDTSVVTPEVSGLINPEV